MNCLEILFGPFLRAYSTNSADIGGLLRHPTSGNLGRALRVTHHQQYRRRPPPSSIWDKFCGGGDKLFFLGVVAAEQYTGMLMLSKSEEASSDKLKECLGQNEVEL
ncbi:hypothetical protein C8R43DRAFT_957942 [Mycena crocata]|nr:hypothetical protein C8R43DRAFT_957942 [Mycena crocata]